jgi:hypothetical protein
LRVDRNRMFLGWQWLRVTQSDGIHAAIDVHDFTGNAAGQIGEHEGSSIADFINGHVTAQRCMVRIVGQQLAKIANT